MVTARDIIFLLLFWRYWFVNVPQISWYTGIEKPIVRNRVHVLRDDGLIRCSNKIIVDSNDSESQAPVYVLCVKGSCELAKLTNDAKYILDAETSLAQWQSIPHYRKLTGFQMLLDKAVETQQRYLLTDLTFEHKVADPKSTEPSKRYFLYQKFESGVVCIPDLAFVLRGDNVKPRVFFVEFETGSDGPADVWKFKQKGYVQIAATKRHQVIFPGTNDFRILLVCPYRAWLDSMRKAMKTSEGELLPGANLWLLVDLQEVKKTKPEDLLTAPIWWKANGDTPVSLVPAPKPTVEVV